MKEKILVVDDQKAITDILEFHLKKEGYIVFCAHDGSQALDIVEEIMPDLILLDIMLPFRDGIEVCREVRKKHEMPIIMLADKQSEIDKVLSLEIGADDYITKPFLKRELMARVKAKLRRYNMGRASETSTIINVGSLIIDPVTFTVVKRGQTIQLTPREFKLIHYLAQHTNQVMTKEHLLRTVWGYEYPGDVRTVSVTVRHLREKIEDDPSHPAWILTRRGIGYYLNNPEQI